MTVEELREEVGIELDLIVTTVHEVISLQHNQNDTCLLD